MGLAMALRTIPAALQYARMMERYAPGAWLVNFTNPAGLITQALLTHSQARVVGICDTPAELFHRIAWSLGEPFEDMEFRYAGLNHLGWVRRVCRPGTTDLFAAFNTADGTVISQLRRHHRAAEFKKFLARIDQNVPAGLGVHLVCDNLATHKTPVIQNWLARHPRFCLHFTPDRIVLDQPGRAVVRLLDRSDDPPRRAQERAGPRSRHPRLDRELERQPAAIRLDQDRRRDPGLTGKIYSEDFRARDARSPCSVLGSRRPPCRACTVKCCPG